MFTNATFFRVAPGFELPAIESLEEALRDAAFIPCGMTQPESSGWIAPRGETGQLAEIIDGHLLVKLCTERRAVPGQALKDAVDEKVARYKEETGHARVPAKLKREFKEEALLDLLPRAFAKRSSTLLWLDAKNRMLVVDAPSLAGADRIVSSLLAAFVDLGVDPGLQMVQTQASPAAAMAHWLSTHEAPWKFTVDRDCELKSPDEQKSTVRYARHTLETDEVAQHIAAGKVPTRLAMTWNDRVSFVLTEGGQVRRIKLLDVVVESDKDDARDSGFDTDAAIFTGEFSQLLPDLLLALGGELVAAA